MTAATHSQIVTARVAFWLAVALALLGVLLYGWSAQVHHRIWTNIIERPGGPMTFRFVLQPCMAAFVAFLDGVNDARLGRPPYLQTMLTSPRTAIASLREGVISTGRIILLGIVMDGIYQYVVLKEFYPGEMVIMALLLAFVPYILLRGLFDRIAGRWFAHKHQTSQ